MVLSIIFMGNKEVSPGCSLCREGNWLCVYVTGRCTRDCYFCPQVKEKKDFPGFRAFVTDWIRFDDAEEVVSYLKHWGITGLGISGGEPLLVADKVLKLVSLAKHRIPGIYIWIYTNGDLVTKELLLKLRKAGLDELRFDLSARDYDLKPVRLAAGIIETLTVEVPVIPKDQEKLIGALQELDNLGVKYVNLQEATVTEENVRGFEKQGISLKGHKGTFALNGSLSTANNIAKHIARRNLELKPNLCTLKYKTDKQTRLILKRMGKINK
jgi:uncharacterized protein